ncbi:MAG: right-handed parallel beta-helix repeat-containing protein [Acidobacteria bacterium]|nr:right-handed parallel beta-helix repeat-containing protein [Acidobacteriota bacterium]
MDQHGTVVGRYSRVIVALLFALGLAAPSAAVAARPPSVLFVDHESGPVTGGINGHGAPLAIFGTGFGATRGGSTVRIGGIEVASYLVWGSRNAHNQALDLIVVEPGAAVTGGPITVTVDGQASAPAVVFTAAAGDVYVIAPTGSDAAACRVDAPCRTLLHTVTNRMRPGDVVLVRGGDYDESEVWIRGDYGHSGTAAAAKVVARYPGEEPLFSNAARPIIVDADYIVFSGLRFSNGKSVGIGSNERGRTGVRVVDSTFEGQIAWDAIGTHGDNHVLAGNVCRVSGSSVGTQGHCYYISFGTGVRLSHNIGDGAPGYGIHVFDQRRQANDFQRVIRDLVIEGNVLSGSTLRSGLILAMADESGLGNLVDGVVVRNNVFTGNNHTGMVVTGLVRNVTVRNNTFVRNGRQGLHVASAATIRDITVQNNLFDEGPNGVCQSNCSWYQAAHGEFGGLAQSVSVSTNYLGTGAGLIGAVDNAPVTGPLTYLDAAALDFRPARGSAVVDAGLAAVDVPRDFTGLPRPRGPGHDIGAFEYEEGDTAGPPAPAALVLDARVAGRTVMLSWQAHRATLSGAADLEARSRPLGHLVAAARFAGTSVVVPGVADGAYYVRVAAPTAAGERLVSNQIRVVVGTPCEPPDMPAGFGAIVSGTTVHLRWSLAGPPAAAVELAVGYAPGRTDLGPLAVGPAPISVAAPPGRYFVRARARNACGVSPFTEDVDVPVGT